MDDDIEGAVGGVAAGIHRRAGDRRRPRGERARGGRVARERHGAAAVAAGDVVVSHVHRQAERGVHHDILTTGNGQRQDGHVHRLTDGGYDTRAVNRLDRHIVVQAAQGGGGDVKRERRGRGGADLGAIDPAFNMVQRGWRLGGGGAGHDGRQARDAGNIIDGQGGSADGHVDALIATDLKGDVWKRPGTAPTVINGGRQGVGAFRQTEVDLAACGRIVLSYRGAGGLVNTHAVAGAVTPMIHAGE